MNRLTRRLNADRRTAKRKLTAERLESRLALAVEPVADLAPLGNGNPHDLTTIASVTYFAASDRDAGEELWRTDGTTSGTARVSDIAAGPYGSYPRELTNFGGKLFFRARTVNSGYELWSSDGTSAGTAMIKDIRSGTYSSTPTSLTPVGSTLFFVANDGTNEANSGRPVVPRLRP